MSAPDFHAVYETARERILALCVHLTGNRALAEDAFQETFLLVHAHLAGFRGEADAGTWVYRIAVRVCLRLRDADRRQRRLRADAAAAMTEIRANSSPATEREDVFNALEALDDDHRTVLALMAVKGLTGPEIARVLDVPIGTVHSRAHRARALLRAALKSTSQVHPVDQADH